MQPVQSSQPKRAASTWFTKLGLSSISFLCPANNPEKNGTHLILCGWDPPNQETPLRVEWETDFYAPPVLWSAAFLTIQRQRCIKILHPKDPQFYTPLALNCQKGQHLPAPEVYKNQSPIEGTYSQFSHKRPLAESNFAFYPRGACHHLESFFSAPFLRLGGSFRRLLILLRGVFTTPNDRSKVRLGHSKGGRFNWP